VEQLNQVLTHKVMMVQFQLFHQYHLLEEEGVLQHTHHLVEMEEVEVLVVGLLEEHPLRQQVELVIRLQCRLHKDLEVEIIVLVLPIMLLQEEEVQQQQVLINQEVLLV
jgi:hypothetical protein